MHCINNLIFIHYKLYQQKQVKQLAFFSYYKAYFFVTIYTLHNIMDEGIYELDQRCKHRQPNFCSKRHLRNTNK